MCNKNVINLAKATSAISQDTVAKATQTMSLIKPKMTFRHRQHQDAEEVAGFFPVTIGPHCLSTSEERVRRWSEQWLRPLAQVDVMCSFCLMVLKIVGLFLGSADSRHGLSRIALPSYQNLTKSKCTVEPSRY